MPGCLQEVEGGEHVAVAVTELTRCGGAATEVALSSRQRPNHPGVLHVVVEDVVTVDVDVVDAVVVVVVVVDTLMVELRSKHPNQPGVLHVDVGGADVLVTVAPVVVDSSKQPHHPGV